MYKILLHIGLPKTATTSLQNNVFLPLHQQNKVYFLGKAYQYNQFNPVFFQIKDELLSVEKIQQLRQSLQPFLDEKKTNIISEENISVSFISNFEVIFSNLRQLFINDDLSVLTSIRCPVDYLFSHFVEDYYWRFFADKKRNTWDKFIVELTKNPHAPCYQMYFLEVYLSILKKNFPQLTILLFEDIKYDPEHYLQQLSQYLNLVLPTSYLLPKTNIKKSSKNSKYSHPITLEHFINHSLYFYPRPLRFLLRKLLLIKWLRELKIQRAVAHHMPDLQKKEEIAALLNIKNVDFAKEFNLDAQKLKKYHYL